MKSHQQFRHAMYRQQYSYDIASPLFLVDDPTWAKIPSPQILEQQCTYTVQLGPSKPVVVMKPFRRLGVERDFTPGMIGYAHLQDEVFAGAELRL